MKSPSSARVGSLSSRRHSTRRFSDCEIIFVSNLPKEVIRPPVPRTKPARAHPNKMVNFDPSNVGSASKELKIYRAVSIGSRVTLERVLLRARARARAARKRFNGKSCAAAAQSQYIISNRE